ncbi:MAG TPA: gamma-glutamyltransferase family protein [Stellaceae bacterium]|nr:gamma-glutamyltransferase family protein [Stellaceae bacterium]
MTSFTTRPEIRGTFGVVASTHWLASAAGMGVLERGGNAFDAAVAAGLVLQVVEPHLNGPAGEAPMILWDQRRGAVEVICGQGVSPQGATIAAFKRLGLDLIPGTGLLAACVPAAFDAWMRLLLEHGTLRLGDIMAPALGYATRGYPVVPRITATIETVRQLFETEWQSSAAIYLPGGRPPSPGRLFRNPVLAATYERLLREAEAASPDRDGQIEAARRIWAEGFVAAAIDRFCRTEEVMDSSGRRHRGLLTGDDMARWRAGVEAPLRFDYHGYTVCKCGPWTQGPVLLQQLALLEDFDLGAMDPVGPDFVHAVVESAKLAFADREAWYGDPDFVDVPIAALLSRDYAKERRALIGETASFEQRPGAPDGRTPRLYRGPTGSGAALGTGEPTMARAGTGEPTAADLRIDVRGASIGDTCHLDIIDRWGNMVSVTPSGGWLHSSPAIPELGFALGTRMQMFWLEEGLPLSLAPGRRPRSTLTPSFALKEGEPYMPFGTPGGDQQDQWSLLLFLHHVHHGMNLQEAIDCPAFHTEHMTSSFWPRAAKPGLVALEGRFPPATVAALRRRGHEVQLGGDWSEGRLSACAAERTPEGTVLKAGANPRGMQGYAVGR